MSSFGFHSHCYIYPPKGSLIDRLGVVSAEAPSVFSQATKRSTPITGYSSEVSVMLTRLNKNVFIQNGRSGHYLNELSGRKITTSTSKSSSWKFVETECPNRSYAVYASPLSGKTCYNIRNSAMDLYLGNNGVKAFQHSGTGENDILGSYVVESEGKCNPVGQTVRCTVQIVSSFYTDRFVLADHSENNELLRLLPSSSSSALQWELIFEEAIDLAPILASSGPVGIRNAETFHHLNELDDGSIASVLDFDHLMGDKWIPVTQQCFGTHQADCYVLMNQRTLEILTGPDGTSIVSIEKSPDQDCYFSDDESNEVIGCPARISLPWMGVCLGQERGSDSVSFANCGDNDGAVFMDWLLLF